MPSSFHHLLVREAEIWDGRDMGEPKGSRCWLVKSEPESRLVDGKDVKFSISDLTAVSVQSWDGVRNAEASKIMREKMSLGDRLLFYHSSCKVPGVVGLATVCREGYPDHTAWDKNHPYFDAKTNKDKPRWYMVDVRYERAFEHIVPLSVIQRIARDPAHKLHDRLKDMTLVRRGRLSVQPVSTDEFETITQLGDGTQWSDLVPLPTASGTKKDDKVREPTAPSPSPDRKRPRRASPEPHRRSTRSRK